MAAPPAGDAGLDLVIQLQSAVHLQLPGHQRPGADDGHIALEDVDELGHLVQAGLAQQVAHLGDAGVVLEFLVFLPLLGVGRVLQHFLQNLPGVPDHGAEFDELEGLAVQAHPGLGVEDRLRIPGEQEGQLHNEHQRQQAHEADEAENHIHQPLDGDVDHLLAGEGVDSQAQGLVGAHGGDELVVRLEAHHGLDAQVDALAVVDEGFVNLRRQNRGLYPHKQLLNVIFQDEIHNALQVRGVPEFLLGLRHPAQSIRGVDGNGDHLVRFSVQDADALHGVLPEEAGMDGPEQLGHIRPGAQDEDGLLGGGHGACLAGAQQILPQQPGAQGQEDVKAVGHQDHRPGIGGAHLHDVEQNAAQDEIVHRLTEGAQQLLAAEPAENAGEGAGEEDHHQVQQAHDGQNAPPVVPAPEVKGPEAQAVGQHKGEDQGQHIQRHKVQMLQPAVFSLDVSCVNPHWLSLPYF